MTKVSHSPAPCPRTEPERETIVFSWRPARPNISESRNLYSCPGPQDAHPGHHERQAVVYLPRQFLQLESARLVGLEGLQDNLRVKAEGGQRDTIGNGRTRGR